MSHRPLFSSPPASRGRPRSRRAAGLAAAGLTAAALTLGMVQLPAATGAPAARLTGEDINDFRGLGDTPHAAEDIDLRGSVEAALSQKDAARTLGADVRWNEFGTPASILPRDGSLGAASTDPAEAPASARAWLRANRGVLGLTLDEVNSLEVVENQEFAQSDARAVLFRQKWGNLSSAIGGMVTVGVANGEIAYVSSSLVKDTSAPPAAALTPEAGWLKAAVELADELGAAGLGLESVVGAADISEVTTEEGWTRLTVDGFEQEQQARVRALPLADGTVRPVIEANVVNVANGVTAGYTSLVDAVTGETLWRQSQVDQAVDSHRNVSTMAAMPTMEDNPSKHAFQGEFTADCGERHEFEITDNDTRQIVAVATALNPANDITLKLWGPGNELLTNGDTGTSPEAATYSSDTPLPQGTYSAQPCMFEGAAPLPPAQYFGNVSVSSQGGQSPSEIVPFPPKWRYFPTNPTPKFGTEHSPKNWVTGCWVTSLNQEPIKGCTEPTGTLRNNASAAPWDVNPNSELPTFTTLGNNASDREAWFSPLTPGGFLQAPFAPDRAYTNKFTDEWNNSKCNPTNLHPGGNDILFSVQNLFVSHNRMHDFSYFLGFTEKNYNLQQNNFGNGGLGNDPEIGNVQAGALTAGAPSYLGRDNANQITLQDGTPGVTNQYLFQPIAGIFYAPCTDGGLDMGIVGHEYTHAITNRMVGGPDEGLTADQGGAMGESWGDLVGAEYQFSHGYRNGGNIWAVGLYATGNLKTAIRNYSINNNPLTFGELGYDSVGNQVHADGEIWSATNWRVRQALVKKHSKRFPYGDENLQVRCSKGVPNLGPKQSYECPGNRRWIQLMFDSFLLQQGATGMLDARDAFIAADRMRYDGGNKSVIWKAFARSGMGVGAKSETPDEGDPKPSFAAPSGNTTVTFRPTLPNGKVAPGKVYIGTYEGRATPVGDTLGKSKLDATIPMTPGTYRGIFQSGKTGLTRFKMKVTGGGSMVERFTVRKNLSGAANGAKVVDSTEGSRNVDALIDSTEATNWGGVTEGNVDKTNPFVTVDLAGKKAKTIRRVGVSALLRPAEENDIDPDSGSRFTALRKFAIDVCASACDEEGSWSRAFTSKNNAFPAKRPRPTSPKLNFREFTFDAVKATHVRLVVLENQCTGFKGYAGELDTDPANPTDCKSGSDRGTIVHAAELEVFDR